MRPLERDRRPDAGISELQGSLALLVIILTAVLVIKATVGDTIVSAALDFGHFKVWGTRNSVSFSKDAPLVIITSPPDGSRFYADQYVSISGIVRPAANRSAGLVYFRLNGGSWKKMAVNNNTWSNTSCRYPEGSYHVEAVAYDNAGDESPVASCTFETVFRLYPDAALVSDDVPAAMTAGDSYDLHIRYANTGYLPWNDSAGYALAPNGSDMPLPRAGFSGEQVQPHEEHTFNVTMTAPDPGDYSIDYRMQCPDYGWFGDELLKPVRVVASYHDARLVSMDMPSDMEPGQAMAVNITMENTGTAAWYSGGADPVYLAMVDGTAGDAYKFNGSSDKISMAPGTVIRNGSDYTFQFKITAPGEGSYYTQYRMMWANHYVFGQIAGCTINVKAQPTPTPTPTPSSGGTTTSDTTTPTPMPMQYNAHGRMILKYLNGAPDYTGILRYYYDGPLGNHFDRASRGASDDSYPYWDWDIGGPNGNYRIYNDINNYKVYRNGGFFEDYPFDMNNGGNKGRVIFYK